MRKPPLSPRRVGSSIPIFLFLFFFSYTKTRSSLRDCSNIQFLLCWYPTGTARVSLSPFNQHERKAPEKKEY